MNNKISLGDTVEDIHTGFKGIAMVYSKFFNGCEQYDVLPKVGKDNIPKESQGIDVQSLKVIKKGPNHSKQIVEESDEVGGPISKLRIMRGC